MRKYILVAALLCLIVSPAFAQNGIPVVNASFEASTVTANGELWNSVIPGWTTTGKTSANNAFVSNGTSEGTSYGHNIGQADGNQSLWAACGGAVDSSAAPLTFTGQLVTPVQYQAGHTYQISAYMRGGSAWGSLNLMTSLTPNGATNGTAGTCLWEGTTGHTGYQADGWNWISDIGYVGATYPYPAAGASGMWVHVTKSFTINTGNAAVGTYIIPQIYVKGSSWAAIDNFQINDMSTPEPGSLFALGMGMMSLAGIAIRRRK